MSSGRKQFSKFKKTINFLGAIVNLLPRFVLVFWYDCTRQFSQLPFILLRYLILKALVKNCGDNIRIGTNVTIKNWKNLELGSNISIHDNCYIDASGGIMVGDNVSIAHNSTLLSSTHTFDDLSLPIKYNKTLKGPLNIHEDVWIGCGVRVLNNLTISSRVVIAAGAIVNKSLEPGNVYGGVPAKKIKAI